MKQPDRAVLFMQTVNTWMIVFIIVAGAALGFTQQ